MGTYFFSVDARVRAAVLLAVVFLIFWWILGKVVIFAASLIPYLMRFIFKLVYLVIEIPICLIHSKVGSYFHEIDNRLANVGSNIDSFLEKWYTCWHNPKNKHIPLSIAIYFLLIIWICIPYHPDTMNKKYISGQHVYLTVENKFTRWLEKQDWYEEQVEEVVEYNEKEQAATEVEAEDVVKEIVMTVNTQKDPLSIRDVPSIENCEVLERVEKGNTVIWKGDMAFGIAGNRGIEPWIKVETLNGTVGWARLMYLCPMDEENFELKLHMD